MDSPLHVAARANRADIIELLHSRNPELIHEANIAGKTPIQLAASSGNVDAINALVRCGAPLGKGGLNCQHPLNIAAREGHIDAVEALLQASAPVNLRDGSGYTALAMACRRSNSYDMAKLLLSCGADPSIPSIGDKTPLMAAASRGDLRLCSLLVLHDGVDTNYQTAGSRVTALILAAQRAHSDTGKLLINFGADPNAVDRHGYSALTYSVSLGHDSCVKMLLLMGADISVRLEPLQYSLLHIAASRDRWGVAKMLVRHGIDPWAKTNPDDVGRCYFPVELAHQEDMRSVLSEAMADVHLSLFKRCLQVVRRQITDGMWSRDEIEDWVGEILHWQFFEEMFCVYFKMNT